MIPLSIIIISYNRGLYLPQNINSIIDQNFSFCYEIIIIDDDSTDNTKEIIEDYFKKAYQDKTLKNNISSILYIKRKKPDSEINK